MPVFEKVNTLQAEIDKKRQEIRPDSYSMSIEDFRTQVGE
jgi:hypothetical protein